jgi:membrane associated rhomboid family serine protease
MIPLGDNIRPTQRPVMTWAILAVTWGVWLLLQQAGTNPQVLAASVCNFGMVPGELTHRAVLGFAVPIGPDMACVVDNDRINRLTPLLSIFLHGGWGHIIGNSIYLWVFGNNVEGAMGPALLLGIDVLCGLLAAGPHNALNPA